MLCSSLPSLQPAILFSHCVASTFRDNACVLSLLFRINEVVCNQRYLDAIGTRGRGDSLGDGGGVLGKGWHATKMR
jgi:hypothetical protein